MADLGQSEPPTLAPGAAEIARLQAARKPDGSPAFSSADIAKYQQDTTQKLLAAGFSIPDIEKHWGTTPPNSPQVAAHVANNIQKAGVTEAHDPLTAFEAGFGTSVAGIAANIATGKNPNVPFEVQPGKDLLNGIAQAAGQQVGDIATGVLGFFGGAAAGAAVPGLGETGVSEAAGAVAGAAGMGIASQGTREILLDAYNRGQIHNVSDFLHVVGASTIRTLKAGAESAPFGLAGPIGGKVLEATGSKVAALAGGTAGATALGVSTGAALNGRMPDANDFVTAAATMLVAHGVFKAGSVVKGQFRPSPEVLTAQHNLEQIYRRNGTTPWDAINQARNDPGLLKEIMQQDVNGDSVAPRMHALAAPEPPPVHGAAEAKDETTPSPPPAPKPVSRETPPPLPDTRGKGIQYHGARASIPQLSEGYYNPANIYGGMDTFYTTDARDIAAGYMRKKPSAQVYQVNEKYPVNMYDMEKPKTAEQWTELLNLPRPGEEDTPHEEALGEAVDEVTHGGKTANLREIMDEVRANSRSFGLSRDEVQEGVFDPIIQRLKALGYGGMSHTGGLQSGRPAHLVKIYFDAPNQLSLSQPPVRSGAEPEIIPPPKPAPVVTTFEQLSTALEGSRDDSVSPKGAIGKHQIMLGTARQYGFGEGMSDAELIDKLHDPSFNAEVFGKIAADLHARFHGDMNAMLIAYNAGPGRAGEYLTKGPGTELVAIPDKTARGGIRYESQPSQRDESWLPMETQKYLANGRRRSGGATEDEGASREVMKIPNWKYNPPPEEEEKVAEDEGSGGQPPIIPPGEEPPGPEEPGGKGFWQRASDDHIVDTIMANIGEPPKPPSLLDPDRLMEQYVSELTPARNIDTGLVREGLLNRNRDVGQEDMFRQTYASDTRTGAFVRFGILKIDGNAIRVEEDSPSIMKAADEVREAGGNMRGWVAYMLARRTADKELAGVKTGFNPAASSEIINRPSFKIYEKATQTFNDVMDGGLEYGRDSGLFSQAQIEAMQRDNPAYISMRRVMGDDESFGTGRRGFAARDPLHLMEGSDRQIIDPIYATIDNLRVIVAMADRNRAVGSIIGQVEMGKLDGLGLKKLPFRPNETIAEPGSDVFKPYGLGTEGADDPEVTYQSLLAERSQKSLAPNEFIYYRNGVAERWQAKNPALVTLMRKSVGPGEANIIGKVFDTIASLDRAGVVLDPSFPTRVTLRHQITAFIADPLHPPPFLTWMNGIQDVLTKSGVFQDWIANGGAGTALADMDVKWLQRDMETVFQDQGVWSRLWNTVQHPLQAYQFVSERIDAAARVGYYKQALAKDIEPLKAATMSRKAMLDYAERASLEGVNSIARKVPFLRPKILGIKMFAENFADRPASTAAYGAAGILGFTVAAVTVPTMLLYAANYYADKSLPDEEKFSSIPRYIRDTHYITPPIAGARIQFPFPFVVGTIFGGLVNRFLDSWVKSDPHAFDDWASSILSDYNPFNLMPAAIKTPIESVANYNFFSGHAIVPSSVEAADGYMQYTNATTEPAKALSRWLGKPGLNLANFSPMQTEHWIDGWTGPIGMGILKAVNGTMTDYKPPPQMADIPVAGTFFVRNPEMRAQQIEDFYTDLKAMEAAHADWSLALKHGNEGEIATAANGPFFGLRIVGKIAAALRIQAAAVASVNKDTTLRPEEKSQAVDQILNSMIQLSIMGSGITAEIQNKKPSQAFQDLDKQNAWSTALATK